MDVESSLRDSELPEVSVMVDPALVVTAQRGISRRRRRTALLGVGAVLVVAAMGFGLPRLIDRDPTTDVATGPTGADTPSNEPGPGDPALRDPEPSTPSTESDRGDVAVWDLDPAALPSAESSNFTAMVTRLNCNNGVTGTVLRPGIVVTADVVTVTFTVKRVDPNGRRTCQGNDTVRVVVDVGQPIGGRTLVDGACAEGPAAPTSFCADNAGIRWRPDGGSHRVRGQMVSVGGPVGAGVDSAQGTVRALDEAGTTIATVETDANGNFELLLPSGTYRLVGRSPSYQGGAVDCTASAVLAVASHAVEGVGVECQRQ